MAAHYGVSTRARPRAPSSLSPAAPASARKNVLELTELLEQILSRLPMQYLLLAQGVCRRWRDIIERSKLLQQLLFFQAVPVPALTWLDWRYDRQEMYQCRIGEPLKLSQGNMKEYPPHWGRTREDNGRYRVFVNPLLAMHLRMLSDLVLESRVHDNSMAMQRPEASWKRMLVTQPAVQCMVVEYERDPNRWTEERGWQVFALNSRPGEVGVTGSHLDTTFQRLRGIAWLKGRQQMEMFEGVDSFAKIERKSERD